MKHKITVSKCKVRNDIKWRVRWHDAGRTHRKFFSSRDGADAHAANVRGDAISARKRLAGLNQAEQEQLILIHDESVRRGVSLSALLTLLASANGKPSVSPALDDVLDEMISTKKKAGRNDGYLYDLKNIISGFSDGRERLSIDKFTVREVESFLDSKKIGSRSTLRARLSTLFKFAVRRGYRIDNPCNMLEAITVIHKTPEILTIAETEKCLKWLRKNPRSLAWFVLSTFAGLRPEEAEKTTWKEINFDEGWIRVEAQTTKIRQRRVVYPLPMAFTWLRAAKRLKSQLPLGKKPRREDRVELRAVLGWEEWKQDVTRHTAASMWLAHTESAEKVSKSIGNSESVLKRDYMALVTKVNAEKFWAILPT